MNFLSGIPGVIILTSTPRLAARHNACGAGQPISEYKTVQQRNGTGGYE